MQAFLFVALALAPCLALADFAGHVVKVTDGDTITVLVKKRQVRVRLESIDAPESKQAFGKRSQQSLAQLCAAKTAIVVSTGKDRYGRTLGWVLCDGIEANTEQVRRGMAWVYVQYAARNSPLYGLEAGARRQRVGLWADTHPIAPWDWRSKKRTTEVGERW
jgi:endonuclease YncB( thermonuclease family)